MKIIEYWSNLKLRLISNVWVFIQLQLVVIVSTPSLRNRKRGSRLTKKANFTAVFTCRGLHVFFGGWGFRVVNRG